MAAIAAGLGGGLISGIFGAQGGKAQASAEKYAAQLQAQEADKALNFQQQEWNTAQANEAPWLAAGKGGLQNLQAILAQPGQGWNQTFTPPTAEQAAKYPGYEFQLQQGLGALENSASARGASGSANTAEALANYAEKSAQSDYTNVYNQAFNEYLQNYGQYNNQLNRLAALSGTGQTSASTLGAEGQAAAGNTGNILLTSGAQRGQDIANAATATASGYTALGNALGGSVANIPYLLAMQQILGGNNISALGGTPPIVPAGDAAIYNDPSLAGVFGAPPP